MNRAVTTQIGEIYRQLGETDQNVVGRVTAFIDQDRNLPREPVGEFFDRVYSLTTADTEQTRESRMQTMLQAGMEWLETAKGPGLNLLHITGRTGLIVAFSEVLRQVVNYHIEQALREGDSTEATRAWMVAAISMVGPALTLIGAIRHERDGTASPASRLGRVGMAVISVGALILAHSTGATSTLLPAVAGGVIYTLVRGLLNAVFPLTSNAGAANARNTGATTAAYGAAQFLLAELGQMAPLSGAARAAAGLGYSLGADAIKGALNGFGMALDDVLTVVFKSLNMLNPSLGRDSVLFDLESWRQTEVNVRAGIQLPTAAQLGDAAFDIGAMRLSAGHAISLVVGAVGHLLSESDLDEGYQAHILTGCLAMMAMLIYFPLIFGSGKRTDNTYALQQIESP
ncbi:hypothetical protein [Pseudomonas putida]|uniref:hypothetical protein n=1 Tax=Pseudomonas putida TaxID=303 RepID=UPI003D9779D5